MKNLRLLFLFLLLVGISATPTIQASAIELQTTQANFQNNLTFDLACNGTDVCRIENASMAALNENVIWLYQPSSKASYGMLDGKISLELPDGSSRGYAISRPTGVYFALGMSGEGSLSRFMAYGTLSLKETNSTTGLIIFHANGNYTQYN